MPSPELKIPDLDWEYPPCSVCPDGGDMQHDGDCYRCEDCGCWWSNDGTGGQAPDDEDDTPRKRRLIANVVGAL